MFIYSRFIDISKGVESIVIGENIRRIRKEKGLTIKDISKKADLTKGLISQIENNKANPSINSLMAIAKALNVPIASFFDQNGKMENPVVKKDKRKVIKTQSGITYYLLNPSTYNSNLELLYVVYEKGSTTGTLYTHEGEESGIVLEGKLEIIIDDKKHILEEGDSITLTSDKPHKFTNINNGVTVAIWVNSPATF